MRIVRDLRFAVRTLARAPIFTAAAVGTLALGIGAGTAIFSIVDAVVLRPLDYPEPERLIRITSELTGLGATDTGITPAELADYRARTDLFTGVAGILPIGASVTSGEAPERIDMMLVTWNYFDILGVAPAYGRVFDRADEITTGVANIAVVSHQFWRSRLGADPAAVGRSIVIDGDSVRIVGVMPSGFRHPGRTLQGDVAIWSPAGFPAITPSGSRSQRRLEGALARLRPGMTLEQAQARLDTLGAAITRRFPADYPRGNGWKPLALSLQDDVTGRVATGMYVLAAGVGLLLLVAAVNVAHLVLARASARRQEMAMRVALGARQGRLILQLAAEGALLAGAGGAAAILVAEWAARGLVALAPAGVPRLDDVSVNGAAITVTMLLALAVTVLLTFAPVLQIRRGQAFAMLKQGGSGRGTDARAGHVRSILVVAEVAMAAVLLVGAGLFIRTVVGILDVPAGFDAKNLLTARIALPRPNDASQARYLDPSRRTSFYREALMRVEALPGVERAALSSQIPLGGFNAPLYVEIEPQRRGTDGRQPAEDGPQPNEDGPRPVVHFFEVSPGYFGTLRIPLLEGRNFSDRDDAAGEPVAIVSETAARTFWGGRSPIGERVRFDPRSPWITVVGVTADVHNRRLTEPPQPILYRPLGQSSSLSMALMIRMRTPTANLGEAVGRAVREIDPEVPVYAVRTMEDLVAEGVGQRRFLMRLLAVFGALATALALLGIYTVMAYSVAERTREIGVRIAIGARQRDVTRMVLGRGMALTGAGLAAGLAASAALSGLVRSQLYGVRTADPLTIAVVAALMAAAATGAAYLPARRAARIDPVRALRDDG